LLSNNVKLTPVIGIGAGGHAKVVIEILRLVGGYDFVGLLDANPETWGTRLMGVGVLGDDVLLAKLYQEGVRCVFIGKGAVGDTGTRKRLYQEAQRLGFEVVRAVHPQAIVSSSAEIGNGPTVMAGAVINAAAHIGDNVIINTGAIVEHDCVVESHVHVATGARLAGGVRVGEGAHIGMGASIKQGITISRQAIVGAGAVVVRDVPDGMTVAGVPAKVLNKAGV
jgi:sugar O-acyltransferase (sialic acid O-acetyltransferase NeuD family)